MDDKEQEEPKRKQQQEIIIKLIKLQLNKPIIKEVEPTKNKILNKKLNIVIKKNI